MRLLPENGMVLAERVSGGKSDAVENGVLFEREELPEYRVVAVADGAGQWSPGDVVVCASTGTKACLPGGRTLYLFDPKNIAAKVVPDA